ncbi:MAG: twin-arginine translocation signal domain-containing protein, partial [Candidatus Nanopelagicales bacterium]
MGGELVLRSDISRRGFLGGLAAGAAASADFPQAIN